MAGRLKLKNGGKAVLSYETIYRFIYKEENKHLKLWQELPRGHAKRRKWHGRAGKVEKIPNRVSIHDRPEIIETREEFSHWEGDSIVGRGKRHGFHTEVERKTRYLLAKLLPKLDSVNSVVAQIKIFGSLPFSARKTVTLDNGLEFVRHQELTQETGMNVYFADPYKSGQRGTNENTNGLLRRYLPKKTSFRNLSQGELNDIVAEINNRPRKCLGYVEPVELFMSYNNERS
ncbi:IS30 family transposase [Patescibacteria group bacterium]|nr:IS30 family transposase [Patescibacteria group bacterium]